MRESRSDRRAREAPEHYEVERGDQDEQSDHRRRRDAQHFGRAHAGDEGGQFEEQKVEAKQDQRVEDVRNVRARRRAQRHLATLHVEDVLDRPLGLTRQAAGSQVKGFGVRPARKGR